MAGAWSVTKDEEKLFTKFAPSLGFRLPLLPCQLDRLCAVSRALSFPEPLLCVVLQYFGGVYLWVNKGISEFNAPSASSEGATNWNPQDDQYCIKSQYLSGGSFRRYHPDTGELWAESPSTFPGLSMAFDDSGCCYLAGWNNYYYKLNSDCNRLIWQSEGSPVVKHSTTGIAICPTDGLVYASKMSSKHVEVLNPNSGALIRVLAFEGKMTAGQCHPMVCVPLEVDGFLEWVLLVHDQDHQCANIYRINTASATATFVKEFKHGLVGYCNYIFDAKRSRLLIAKSCSSKWSEWTWVP